jgi:hypothetical protein
MDIKNAKLLGRLSRFGVVHREAVKNDLSTLTRFICKGWVKKVYRQGRVFYELTDRALPLLEQERQCLYEEAKLCALLETEHSVYTPLVSDVRFLDDKKPEASRFLFLGDWQLVRPVVRPQLELAKLRFYNTQVPERRKRVYEKTDPLSASESRGT